MRPATIAGVASLALPLGCAVIAGLWDHRAFPAEGGPAEGGPPEAGAKDGRSPPDGRASDARVLPAYNAFDVASNWEFFDVAPLPKASGFLGGAAAGRYVYFASNADSLLRYDTTAPFARATSWRLATTTSIPVSNTGLVSLGQYVYVTPAVGESDVGRYDTAGPFEADAGSFGAFEPTMVNNYDFQGGCTDGKNVYFAPLEVGSRTVAVVEGTVLSYNPAGAGFFTSSPWTTTDLTMFNPAATGFAACVFDGRYIYFGNNRGGTTARYDTTQPIAMSSAWVFFLIDQIQSSLYGFEGLVFTGRYVVYVPGFTTSFSSSTVAYDTLGKFGELSSWTPYNLTLTDGGATAAGYAGGQFDGRYVYMAPQTGGLVVRWDSSRPFNDHGAWEVFDINALHPGANSFYGTAFDGEYVYFSTNSGSAMARFKARSTVMHMVPPGSFF